MRIAPPVVLLAVMTLTACGPGAKVVDPYTTTNTHTGLNTTTTSGTTSGTGTTTNTQPTGPIINPIAVGFEIDAVVRSDGTLTGYTVLNTEIPPTIILTFVSQQFFLETSQAGQLEQSCVAFGTFNVDPMSKPDQIPISSADLLYRSYDGALTIEAQTCGLVTDPNVWGADAQDLWGPFVGAHIGYGFGPMTTYLEGQWQANDLITYRDNLFANYIAINDANAQFIGQDWSSGIVFEWDESSGALISDQNSDLIPIDISGLGPGADLPQGYVRGYSYWYQEFTGLNFSNLSDGAP